jgi:hypothetical protein
VCPLCDDLDGLTRSQVDEILEGAEPGLVHDVCRCMWKHRPKSFAMLAGGAAVPGQDPDAMIVRDPATGERMASVVITFGNWLQQHGLAVVE